MSVSFPLARATCAGLLLVASIAHADEELSQVIVTSTAFRASVRDVVQPVAVLSGEALHQQLGSSIGETLARQPGVSATYFGPAASRPLIRGLGGERVQMLEDGVSALDVSSLSEDHAVSAEDAVARQIEIMKGPATLLYGSGAVGGAINIVTRRIPNGVPDRGATANVELRGDTASRQRSIVATTDLGQDFYALHADGYERRSDDVAIPGGRLVNSDSRGNGGSLGASLIGDAGYVGVSVSHFADNYGVPQANADPLGGSRIDMRQDRYALRGEFMPPGDLVGKLRLSITHSDYQHAELEPGGSIGTQFTQAGNELRATADHRLGGLQGTVGLQYQQIDFQAQGDELFVPPSVTRTAGVFAFEQYERDAVTIEAGLRVERQTVRPAAAAALPDHDGNGVSGSLGALWRLSPTLAVVANLTHSERQVAAPELYADGPHAATSQFVVGDTALRAESALSYDLGLRGSGTVAWEVSLYRNDFANFIYLAPTPALRDGLPVFDYRQGGATLQGVEAVADLPLIERDAGALGLHAAGDYVQGRLRNGGDLPQIPPLRLGGELRWTAPDWNAGVSAWRYFRQDAVAVLETPTAGYTLLGASLNRHWTLAHGALHAFANASNLGNVLARRHSSPLKDIAPLPGRSVTIGLRLEL
jgi:iron complex outermembrane receptor protein